MYATLFFIKMSYLRILIKEGKVIIRSTSRIDGKLWKNVYLRKLQFLIDNTIKAMFIVPIKTCMHWKYEKTLVWLLYYGRKVKYKRCLIWIIISGTVYVYEDWFVFKITGLFFKELLIGDQNNPEI